MYKFKNLKYNSMYKEYYLFRIFSFLLKILLFDLISIKNARNLKNYISEIHLVIKGKGKQEIIRYGFNTYPSEVIVNGISKGNTCKQTCILDENINNVTIKFDKQIKSCRNMFYNLEKIIEIDLSNFDASEVNNMKGMFGECKNLEKINFGNINTSSVKKMDGLFVYCEKLISIDLSNFDTSNINNIENMFYHCQSLIYLNLNSFHLNNSITVNNIFKSISSYVKICANDEII